MTPQRALQPGQGQVVLAAAAACWVAPGESPCAGGPQGRGGAGAGHPHASAWDGTRPGVRRGAHQEGGREGGG
jgi:hypothetical protein